ncbi:MAG: Diaminopimelate decarboxylase [Syntrophorhabdaceae bacterium PtaU1.Bin034]|nr:MAG: Diaminopimelate decarboxylase [Syntrophorhabdaceae bacterium PtaU1.Bin034]
MNDFTYKDGTLHAEDISIEKIAKTAGTPLYVYSYATLKRHFLVFDRAFARIPHITCYSCKANTNIALLRLMAGLGGGADIVSGGELFAALRASVPPERIVYSGVGKTEEEISYAVKTGIAMINIESEGELQLIAAIGKKMRKAVPVSIRVNPEIDAKTHPYITTGLRRNKFGILWADARRLYDEIKKSEYLTPVGISSHIGSQITEIPPFIEAVRSLKKMVSELASSGIALHYMDIGGGLGITYRDELPPHPEEYAGAIEKELEGTGLTLILEPGRVIVGNSGIFVTKLLYVKKTPEKTFYVVDGAMNDLVRPAFYDAYHEILPVVPGKKKKIKVDVVGPICESGDFFAKDRKLANVEPGALLAVMGAGAYGFTMSSNYNSRPRVPEVLVKGEDFFVIRKRETHRDLVRGETIPGFLEV